MIDQGKFGLQETICALVITCTAKEFFTDPSIIARTVGTSGWYMVLISAVAAAVGFTFIYFLLKRFPGKNIMEVYDDVFGKYIGFAFSFLLAGILLVSAGVNLREYVEVLKIYIFPKTPPTLIIGFFIMTVVILSFLGLESMARYSNIAAYGLLFGFIVFFILASSEFEFYRIFPIFGYGLGNTVLQGLLRSSMYGEIMIIAVFAKSLHGIKDIKKAGYMSIILAGIFISLTQLMFILIFSYPFGKEITAPLYAAASLINVALFFQRVEALFLFIWNISTLVSIPILFYMVLMIYSYLFKINDRRPVVIPLAVILFAISMIPSNIVDLTQGYIRYLREFGWIIFYIIPAFALLVAVLRKKKEGDRNV